MSELYMFYEPKSGRMLALGSKKDIEEASMIYMENLLELIRIFQEQKSSDNISI